LLRQIDVRFREVVPSAPARLDPGDPSHGPMIDQWWEVHREVLNRLTDEAFAQAFPDAPGRLDPADPAQATSVAYWNDIAAQIDSGQAGRWDWSNPPTSVTGIDPNLIEIEGEPGEGEDGPIPKDGSYGLEQGLEYVKVLTEEFARPVITTDLGWKVIQHISEQIEVLRGLVRDGTFLTYHHWWRSASLNDSTWDTEDPDKQVAWVRDLSLEAKIDPTSGVLVIYVTGWTRDLLTDESFQRVNPG
jgi:hypothetical protein